MDVYVSQVCIYYNRLILQTMRTTYTYIQVEKLKGTAESANLTSKGHPYVHYTDNYAVYIKM